MHFYHLVVATAPHSPPDRRLAYCATMVRLDYIAVSFAVMLTAGIVVIASLMH
jgi:hypothetical protein